MSKFSLIRRHITALLAMSTLALGTAHAADTLAAGIGATVQAPEIRHALEVAAELGDATSRPQNVRVSERPPPDGEGMSERAARAVATPSAVDVAKR